MKIGIFTDPHGIAGISTAERISLALKLDAMIITGDCWDVNHGRRIPTHYIRGNHEHEGMWVHAKETSPKNVTLHEDYTTFGLGGVTFGVLGRMDEDTHQEALKTLWLGHPSNRSFTKRPDAASLLKGSQVLLFHDSPRPFIGPGFEGGSDYLRQIVETVQPMFVFHGHYHILQCKDIGVSYVIGLPAIDPQYDNNGFAIFDTENLTVEVRTMFRPKRMYPRVAFNLLGTGHGTTPINDDTP